jgi:hypothetical protein
MAEIAKELAVMDQWEQGRREGEEVQSRGMLRVFTVLMGLRRKKKKNHLKVAVSKIAKNEGCLRVNFLKEVRRGAPVEKIYEIPLYNLHV